MKTLVAGWFSFEHMGASAGDLLARDLACDWLREAGQTFDVALAPPFTGGVRWQAVDPSAYHRVVFVCGPFGNGEPVTTFLERFSSAELIGLNLTMLEPLEVWNPFSLLLERDSSRCVRPDISLLSTRPLVPVVGVIVIDSQPEYGDRDVHVAANATIERVLAAREVSRIRIDTRLDVANTFRTPSEIESVISRMSVVMTTRLHGMVLSLKQGIPVVAIDPVAGGAKVLHQAKALGWPLVFTGDAIADGDIDQALTRALTPALAREASTVRNNAVRQLQSVRDEFLAGVSGPR